MGIWLRIKLNFNLKHLGNDDLIHFTFFFYDPKFLLIISPIFVERHHHPRHPSLSFLFIVTRIFHRKHLTFSLYSSSDLRWIIKSLRLKFSSKSSSSYPYFSIFFISSVDNKYRYLLDTNTRPFSFPIPPLILLFKFSESVIDQSLFSLPAILHAR